MLDAIPRHQSGIASRALDGEAVLVNAEQEKIIVLNGVGSRLWELADGQRTIGDMASVISGEYDVSQEKAASDAWAFCQDLAGRGLLTIDA